MSDRLLGNSNSLGLRHVFLVQVSLVFFSSRFLGWEFFLNVHFLIKVYFWEIAAHSAHDMFYKYLIVNLCFFFRLRVLEWEFLSDCPFPDRCLLVSCYLFKLFVVHTSISPNRLTNATPQFIASIAFRGKHYDTIHVMAKSACSAFDVSHTKPDFTAIENVKMIKNSNSNLYSLTRNLRR